MHRDRREFLAILGGGLAAGLLATASHRTPAATNREIRAVAFDAFPIFDPRPIFALAERLFPGQGMKLADAWRTRQFEYQWLRALAGQYADFWQATEDSLIFAAKMLKLDLTSDKRKSLMQAYLALKVWPDVPLALRVLKQDGLRLAFVSNMTPAMLDAGLRNSGLQGVFDHVLSTDRVRTHKPDPRAYRLAMDAFALEKEEILFVPFAAWDVAGAKWFGYPTFWVNRLNQPAEELGVVADGAGASLAELVTFVQSRRAARQVS